MLEAYGLTGCHDSITQINNYAVLLTDLGEAQRGYSAVMKLGRKVRELNSDQCLDYGLIQQTLGTISLVQGNVQQAMEIFEMVFEDEPVLLEQKQQELENMAIPALQNIRKMLAYYISERSPCDGISLLLFVNSRSICVQCHNHLFLL